MFMCGIAGICSLEKNLHPGLIKEMTDSLSHRGPDDEGFLAVNLESKEVFSLSGGKSKTQGLKIETFDKPVNLFLGHRRLSIIDLSSAGHQPMGNEEGVIWIVYNGEIYNYLEIRKELELMGHRFHSHTDTEVILHAYEEWGTDCLKWFNGMWAFAIVDLRRNTVFCSRDRAGVKPFYYLFNGKQFCFASEIKALLKTDGVTPEPNEQIIADYLFSGYLDHTPETFFKNIYQLRPGEYLLWEDNQLTIRPYWDIEPKEVRFTGAGDYAQRFHELLEDSIRLRLRSDVPIGTCLSGGLDSSSIVCIANRLMFNGEMIDSKLVGEKQKTFSSCFEDPRYDERPFIEKVIARTGAEKNYVFPQADALFKEVSELIWHQDEPFGSTSIYAQWNVMKMALSRKVKVLLDGQGGDELMAGYLPCFPVLFGEALKRGNLGGFIREVKGFRKHHGMTLNQLGPRMFIACVPSRYRSMIREFMAGEMDWVEKGFKKRYLRNFPMARKFKDDLNNYLYQIFRTTILPGLLRYEDRNSMAFSLETRLPLLDYRLIEFVFSLPAEQKIQGGVTKVILRNAMQGVLPEEIRNRMDKMGFVTPEDVWFRTLLRGPIENILHSRSFAERGYFDVNRIKRAFLMHCEGKKHLSATIWRWVNLELWFRHFID
jgi:asparagine synthase (glutamine-hydrolysing)